jgi:mono/diheme cytochrome c family protein
VGTGVVAAPASYEVDGKQYVSIAVGWGGVYGVTMRHTDRKGPGTVYTFALGGTAKAPAFVEYKLNALLQGVPYNAAHVPEGTALYVSHCVFCHGVPGVDRGGNVSNLGYSAQGTIANLDKFVLGGALKNQGMPDFTGRLKAEDVEKIKAFIQGTADAVRPKN